jgi:hypothetical protein
VEFRRGPWRQRVRLAPAFDSQGGLDIDNGVVQAVDHARCLPFGQGISPCKRGRNAGIGLKAARRPHVEGGSAASLIAAFRRRLPGIGRGWYTAPSVWIRRNQVRNSCEDGRCLRRTATTSLMSCGVLNSRMLSHLSGSPPYAPARAWVAEWANPSRLRTSRPELPIDQRRSVRRYGESRCRAFWLREQASPRHLPDRKEPANNRQVEIKVEENRRQEHGLKSQSGDQRATKERRKSYSGSLR